MTLLCSTAAAARTVDTAPKLANIATEQPTNEHAATTSTPSSSSQSNLVAIRKDPRTIMTVTHEDTIFYLQFHRPSKQFHLHRISGPFKIKEAFLHTHLQLRSFEDKSVNSSLESFANSMDAIRPGRTVECVLVLQMVNIRDYRVHL
jgi:hypothetical protein